MQNKTGEDVCFLNVPFLPLGREVESRALFVRSDGCSRSSCAGTPFSDAVVQNTSKSESVHCSLSDVTEYTQCSALQSRPSTKCGWKDRMTEHMNWNIMGVGAVG